MCQTCLTSRVAFRARKLARKMGNGEEGGKVGEGRGGRWSVTALVPMLCWCVRRRTRSSQLTGKKMNSLDKSHTIPYLTPVIVSSELARPHPRPCTVKTWPGRPASPNQGPPALCRQVNSNTSEPGRSRISRTTGFQNTGSSFFLGLAPLLAVNSCKRRWMAVLYQPLMSLWKSRKKEPTIPKVICSDVSKGISSILLNL